MSIHRPSDETRINIALCADKNMEPGVHVTLYTALKYSFSIFKIYFFYKGYHPSDIAALHSTLRPFSGRYELCPRPFSDEMFFGTAGLRGNRMPFFKILLGDVIQEQRVLFLDSDLVIKADLAELYDLNLKGCILGTPGTTLAKYSGEYAFLKSLGFQEEDLWFNSGVMLIDLALWRLANLTSKNLKFYKKYSDRLYTADQTVLNCVLRGKFIPLNPKFNIAVWPSEQTLDPKSTDCVFHFLGVPKPWDSLGKLLHRNFKLFQSFLDETSYANRYFYRFRPARLMLPLRCYRVYLKLTKEKILGYGVNPRDKKQKTEVS